MSRREKVHVDHDGRRYNGHYIFDEGFMSVSSAYGSKGMKMKPKDEPALVAAKLLFEIVQSWRK